MAGKPVWFVVCDGTVSNSVDAESSCPRLEISTLYELVVVGVATEKTIRCELVAAMVCTFEDGVTNGISMIALAFMI